MNKRNTIGWQKMKSPEEVARWLGRLRLPKSAAGIHYYRGNVVRGFAWAAYRN